MAHLRAKPGQVASAPQGLTLKTHRDRKNWWQSVWLRRGLLVLPGAIVVLGLVNTFGQRPATTSAAGAAAELTVYAPTHARSGLVYAARFRIDARRDLKRATLVFSPGWAEGYTVNGLTPQPLTAGSTRRQAELRLRAHSCREALDVLALLAGEPDEHRPPSPERVALRRHEAHHHGPPRHHHLPVDSWTSSFGLPSRTSSSSSC